MKVSVVDVDERGRMTIPKEIGLRKAKAAVISAGSFFIVVPIVGDPYKVASSWLKTERSNRDLKEVAEKRAAEDAVKRARRRRQL